MMNEQVYLIALLGLVIGLLHKLLIYPAFLSPLSRIPQGHWSSGFCPLWLHWLRWTNQENGVVYRKHMELGPAVRLAPGVISINCFEEGLKKIYQGGFPKPKFYWNGFAIYNTHNLFTFPDNATHSARKRLVSNVFSKSFVLSSPGARASTRDVLYGRYLPMMERAALEGKALEVLELNYAYSMDTFIQWQYGRKLSSNLLENEEERQMYLQGFFAPYPYLFWMYHMPSIPNFLRKVGIKIIPDRVGRLFAAIEDWNLDKCDQAQQLLANSNNNNGSDKEKLHIEDNPIVFSHALKAMSDVAAAPESYPQRLDIASDMFAHNSAAFETSGNTETYLLYEMCRHPQWQTKLREELSQARAQLRYHAGKQVQIDDLPDPKVLEELPVLHAVIMETLRLWPSVPGGQPRVVPKNCSLAGYDNIPAGTIVQSYAYILHRTPEVFPDPHEWKPERWLNASPAELTRMRHWFWAFGSGGRMCIGSNFAFYSMKFLVAAIFANFTVTIHDHGSMELLDGYLAGPVGHRLEVKFHKLEEGEEA